MVVETKMTNHEGESYVPSRGNIGKRIASRRWKRAFGFAKVTTHFKLQSAIRVAGMLCVLVGGGLFAGVI